jgi:hypothetical protein
MKEHLPVILNSFQDLTFFCYNECHLLKDQMLKRVQHDSSLSFFKQEVLRHTLIFVP